MAVRQAVAYSIDRDAIVARLFGDLGVTKAVQTLNPPIVSKYADTTACSNYTLQPGKVDEPDAGRRLDEERRIWTKDGKNAAFAIKTHGRQQAP